MKEQILITGGAGYIGSHTAVALVEAGYDVVIVDNLSNSDISAVEGIRQITGVDVPFEQVDCCDKEAMHNLFQSYPFRSVIHFAAFKSVDESIEQPQKYYDNNVGSFATLLEVMRQEGRANVLFSSSATVYGQPEVLPVTELTPRQPATSPYGATKQMCEDMLSQAVNASGGVLRGIALRYFNPIGAHPSALLGELPRGVPNNLVPFITQTAAGIRGQLSIFGDDYATPDGTCIRDYIDVMDLASAHVAAIGRMVRGENKKSYEVFNVGTGRGVSVMELVKSFERVNNLKLNYRVVGRRSGDVETVWADTSLAERELGWRAVRRLDDTLRAAWIWEKQVRRCKTEEDI